MKNDLYATRRLRLAALAAKEGCDLFLVTNYTNVSYLTGFSGDDSWLLVGKDRALLVSDTRYTDQIAEECPDLNAYCRVMGEGMYDTIKRNLGQFASHSDRLGVEGGSMTVAARDGLQAVIPKYTLTPLNDLIERLREIKDETEIDAIRKAVTCACRAFNVVRHSVRPGDTELDFSRELECAMLKLGSKEKAFSTIVASGPRAALPHAVPTEQYRVGESEMLLVDWGARTDFYVSDLTRVLITSRKATKKLRRVYHTVLKAQQAAIAMIKPGIKCSTVDATARGIIADAGHGRAFTHNLGHGLGLVVHDRGGFRIGNDTILKPGMVLTVEPGIYYPGWGGVRIEDDILVTRKGCEVLSEGFPKEFDEMIVDW